MTAERATYLLKNSNEYLGPSVDSIMSREERREVIEFWERIPNGNTCFIDALRRISRGIPAEAVSSQNGYYIPPKENQERPTP